MPKYIEEKERYYKAKRKRNAEKSKHKHEYHDAIIEYPAGSPHNFFYGEDRDCYCVGSVCSICGKIGRSGYWYEDGEYVTPERYPTLPVFECTSKKASYVDAFQKVATSD